jgi:hypothetical protein
VDLDSTPPLCKLKKKVIFITNRDNYVTNIVRAEFEESTAPIPKAVIEHDHERLVFASCF